MHGTAFWHRSDLDILNGTRAPPHNLSPPGLPPGKHFVIGDAGGRL